MPRNINPDSFRQRCIREGVSYKAAISRRYCYPQQTDDEIFAYYRSLKENAGHKPGSLAAKCVQENVNPKSVYYYRSFHSNLNLSHDELIRKYKDYKRQNNLRHQRLSLLAEKCEKHGIKFKTACSLEKQHPDASIDTIIQYYLDKYAGKIHCTFIQYQQKCVSCMKK